MPRCPSGHDSADDEFCEVCGRAIGGPAVPDPPRPAPEPPDPDLPPPGARCVACDAALAGRFCESCGHDSLSTSQPPPAEAPPSAEPSAEAPPPPVAPPAAEPAPRPDTGAAPVWTVTVSADRAHYDAVLAQNGPDAAAITFPPFCPDRRFTLRGKQVTIGRLSRSRGVDPDIDLTGPPTDPGVSHLHALLLARADGGWSIVDLDSSNGVLVNDEPTPLTPNSPRPLADGDRVYLGAWTRITLHAT